MCLAAEKGEAAAIANCAVLAPAMSAPAMARAQELLLRWRLRVQNGRALLST
ncbi:hypothetical protein [Duganella phyllosphaerae]|nr:hypothetical protein [Duganella phyllosphaerae]